MINKNEIIINSSESLEGQSGYLREAFRKKRALSLPRSRKIPFLSPISSLFSPFTVNTSDLSPILTESPIAARCTSPISLQSSRNFYDLFNPYRQHKGDGKEMTNQFLGRKGKSDWCGIKQSSNRRPPKCSVRRQEESLP
ncbi:hypothetical protein TNIN_432071 [Trichonephila inaurata madagascariensis]|uniref:Uncharacterized protein n=1 Tax=Trichonephila inaurata madagascariensis TaxID=2747483 RepID=A0A8X6XW79_9ARAC|nr:hypothetical protein TNIN_432071 [Trichonephila inaurata madagascariensis]